MTDQNPTPPGNGPLSRRAVVTATAWSVPVIAFGVAAPAASASCGSPDSRTYGPGTYDLVLPTCVSQVQFEVIGGGALSAQGGATTTGSRIVGTLALPSRGVTLRLVVGAAGTRVNSATQGGVGGAGYGNGGSAPADSRGSIAGGGGTAILIGTTPYVVAGGSGGGHVYNAESGANGWMNTAVLTTTTNGVPFSTGNAGPTPQNGNGRAFDYVLNGTTQVRPGYGAPGRAASGATGGAGGNGQAYNANRPNVTFSGAVSGGNGGNHGTGNAGGGNGGAGSRTVVGTISGVSGGGGGGYAGGGGGGGVSATGTGGERANMITGGGAGSSYTGGAGVSVTSTTSPTAGGNQGFIRISWT
ncbi:hypothetical protein C5E06_09945 [Pseudoclavibacter sp. RFBI5]|uniref:hypothetical protein n=1 Tax=Pseudoclavibacter sp. RFBI5 TaxID=2080578 RepID=UPI000CE7A78B|nr:hypothetical protein [Pseudoclavibacter sp. RFBI5]PPG02762.1 hypothetical protein C5E06_09945 [Pseudoclavibacter sp. RFBI5]